jgi:hypothetical protein
MFLFRIDVIEFFRSHRHCETKLLDDDLWAGSFREKQRHLADNDGREEECDLNSILGEKVVASRILDGQLPALARCSSSARNLRL